MKKAAPALSDFSKKVIAIIKKIPHGKVASYGQIAKLAGKPHGSRGVAWLLHSSSKKHGLPWQRVVNSKGKISFPWGTEAHLQQCRRLKSEKVEVSPEGQIDLTLFQWRPR